METPDICISMGELLEVSVITIAGKMHHAHIPAISAMLSSVAELGRNACVLDAAKLQYPGEAEAEALIKALNDLPDTLNVHLVCSKLLMQMIAESPVGRNVSTYSTTEEIANLLRQQLAS